MAKDIGIDLGTANTLVHVKGKGIVIREPSVVAMNKKTHAVVAVGNEAKKMIGRTPANIVVVRPLREGVIADFEVAEQMLRYFIHGAIGKKRLFNRPNMMICVPSGVTEVERMAVEEAAMAAGAKKPVTIEEPMAAAIGAGLPVTDAEGSMVVDIGGGTTEIAVTSMGGLVFSKSIRVAGDELDKAVIAYLKKEHNLLVGDKTAEEVKITAGAAYPLEQDEYTDVKGKDMLTGLPKNVRVSSSELEEAMAEPLDAIVSAVKTVLENTPPELAADIMARGIMLTGGGALLKGLDKLINEKTGMPVLIAEEPLDCVVRGTGRCLEDARLRRILAADRW